ncbi:hypothetical protein [Arthrobacter sp. MMS24-S77]
MSTQSPVTTSSDIAAPAPVSVHVPSVHVRAVITWLAIFPLVAIGLTILGPLTESWHPALRALVLTLLVVPTAVYFAVPKLLAGYGSLKRRQARKAAARA